MRKSLLVAMLMSARCLASDVNASQLVEYSLEHLMTMNIEVTSTTKREQNVFDTTSAVYVVTSDDIRRSGVTTIPDALRMVPGVQVGQIDNNEWAITIRGLGGRFARYLQVLVDGRSVYDTLFSGINWDELNLTLDDIDRIEVIRGPGASVWGANAVNGVINIVTKKPSARDGTVITVGGGDYNRTIVSGQTSHRIGEHTQFRVSGNHFKREGLSALHSNLQEGAASGERASLALSHKPGNDEWRLNADVYRLHNNTYWANTTPFGVASSDGTANFRSDESKRGYAVQLRYSHHFDGKSTAHLRLSADNVTRESNVFSWKNRNFDVDLEYVTTVGDHYLTVGSNNRFNTDGVRQSTGAQFTLSPPKDNVDVSSLFINDTVTLDPHWKLDVGLRYEDQTGTGDNTQGTLRTLWLPNDSQRVWAAVSKADSTPSRVTTAANRAGFAVIPGIPGLSPPTLISVVSDSSVLKNSELIAYEIGYRQAFSESLTLDAAAFYNDYKRVLAPVLVSNLLATQVEPISGQSYLPVDVQLDDSKKLSSSGVEVSVNWQLDGRWHLQYSGSYINFKHEKLLSGGAGTQLANSLSSYNMTADVPAQQHSLRLMGDLNSRWSVSFWLRHVAKLKLVGIGAYTAFDTQVTYRPLPDIAINLAARNLGDRRHAEAAREAFYVDTFEVERSVYASVRWSF